MSFLALVARRLPTCSSKVRGYASPASSTLASGVTSNTSNASKKSPATSGPVSSFTTQGKKGSSFHSAAETPQSSCPPDTVLAGVNYLKGQPSVVALPDEQYPAWLWTILQTKVWPDDGPGGKAERVKRRDENRKRIKDRNFMQTQ